MSSKRPSFAQAWNLFAKIRVSVKDVGNIIGGKVQVNTESGTFKNACPIRMSYVLNYSGFPVPAHQKYAVVSGKDGRQYMYHVNDMMDYLSSTFGAPDITVKSPHLSNFSGKKGILLIQGHGWRDAKGHVTLWNGATCSDTCHLTGDPENGNFIPDRASLWILK
jgi:hypothetical protein